jgi:hypothetical protein
MEDGNKDFQDVINTFSFRFVMNIYIYEIEKESLQQQFKGNMTMIMQS